MLKAPVLSLLESSVFNTESRFVPGVDWFYQDENENRIRDFGAAPPHGDAKPTFGEQLYVADDVNRNGALDPGERLVRLHTPKVKAARDASGRVYRRGKDLSEFPADSASRFHGTMVLGTLAGSDPDYQRYTGVAPDAELLLAMNSSENLTTALAWAQSEGAQLVLWEMSSWTFEALDGSSPHELACDAAYEQGTLQIGAAGNLGGSQKHRVREQPNGSETIPWVIPPAQTDQVYLQLSWRGSATALGFELQLNGGTVTLSGNGQGTLGGAQVHWQHATSQRATHQLLVYISQAGGVSPQTAAVRVANSGPPVTMHGYLTDGYSGWGKGVYWPVSSGATDASTYGSPAVSDKTLAIGTMLVDFAPKTETKGTLASWSGRGPRLDGQETVDLVAPEDVITALSGDEELTRGGMMVGGGTSNASPVVVGLLALIKSVKPDATPAQLAQALTSRAQVDTSTGSVPNDSWGMGKARVHRALYEGALPTTSQPPVVSVTATHLNDGSVRLDASESSDPDGDPLRVLVDQNYDGTWDLGPSTALSSRLAESPAWASPLKVQVLDSSGQVTTVLVEVRDAPTPAGPVDAGFNLAGTPAPQSTSEPTGPSADPTPAPGCGCTGTRSASEQVTWGLLGLLLAASGRRRRWS
jgi:hypothetical protein